MADNVTAEAVVSAGVVFAADDASSVFWPYTKMAYGADNTQTLVTAANGLPVQNDSSNTFNVATTAQVPGTGATQLGKAIDTAVGSTDTGVAILAKHQAAGARLTTATLDYDTPRLSEYGGLLTEPEQHFVIDDMNNLVGFGGMWAAIDSDTTGVAVTTKHILGTKSIEFDKVNGAADSGIGGVTKALTSINLDGASPHDLLNCIVRIEAVDDIDDGTSYFFLRLGTDSTDYNEWRIDGTEFTANIWETVAMEIGDASYTGQGGAGITWTAITYIAVGFQFDAAGDLEPNIAVDEISFHTNQHVNAAVNAEITSSVASANVNLQKVAGSPATKSSGNVGQGTQRVTLADDDTNALKITNAVEIMDDWDETNRAAVNLIPSAVGVLGGTGTDAANVLRVSLATDIALPAGSATIGVVDLGSTDNAVLDDIAAKLAPNATNGHSFYLNQDTSAKAEIKGGAGTLYWIQCSSIDATPVYLNLYDALATNVTLGSTTPSLQFIIPSQGDANGSGFTINFGQLGIQFATGITVAAATTTGGSTDPGTNVVITNIGFE